MSQASCITWADAEPMVDHFSLNIGEISMVLKDYLLDFISTVTKFIDPSLIRIV